MPGHSPLRGWARKNPKMGAVMLLMALLMFFLFAIVMPRVTHIP